MKNIFEHVIQNPEIKYKHAKGMRDVYGREFHQFHELLLFISGNAYFTTEQKTVKLKPYTLVVIPENTFHTFHINGEEEDYERYVFNFHSASELAPLILQNMKRVAIVESLPKSLIEDFCSLDDNKFSELEKEILIKAKLISILVELGHITLSEEDMNSTFSKITTKCLDYINQNLTSPLSVTDIAKKLNYSRSSITHSFKVDLDIPIYKYIVQKKLILAHKDIKRGVSATEVSLKYAFSDYSCFFRHYKKYFGFAPSQKSKPW